MESEVPMVYETLTKIAESSAGHPLHLELVTPASYNIVTLTGEVDVYTAPALREYLLEAQGRVGTQRTVVDMRRVDFLDSTGLGVLVGSLKKHRELDRELTLVATTEKIIAIFNITGLDKVFQIDETVPEIAEEPESS